LKVHHYVNLISHFWSHWAFYEVSPLFYHKKRFQQITVNQRIGGHNGLDK
jgi:hypothetical protein